MMSIPQKFEAKISIIEESCDLQNLSIAELISKLHIQEQRMEMRDDESIEGVFQANNVFQPKKNFSNWKSKTSPKNRDVMPQIKQNLSPCSYCKRTNHAEKDCWFKGKTILNCDFCNNYGHSEQFRRIKRRQPQQELQQHANVTEKDNDDEEHLFMALQTGNTSKENILLLDSGCTSHMTVFVNFFFNRSIN